MNHLTRNDYASALKVLTRVEAQAGNVDSFARAVVRALHDYVEAELTCDRVTGHRRVAGLPGVRLALLRPHLAFLHRHARKAVATRQDGTPPTPMPPNISPPGLTQREGEVMHWLACGKTDADIAALLAISPRTVQKHLEHVYVKLGVETRTAAVMRALAILR